MPCLARAAAVAAVLVVLVGDAAAARQVDLGRGLRVNLHERLDSRGRADASPQHRFRASRSSLRGGSPLDSVVTLASGDSVATGTSAGNRGDYLGRGAFGGARPPGRPASRR